MNTSLDVKKSITAGLLALAIVVGPVGLTEGADQTPPKQDTSTLAPLAFLTAHEWDAKLPDSPDGKKMSIHARFTWAENRQAIRISNQLVIDGKPAPYIEGIYAWNPEKKAIVFVYAGADGDLSEGMVRLEEGKLVHEFHQIHANGKAEQFVARVTPHGTDGWDNEILARKGDALAPIVQVQYLPAH